MGNSITGAVERAFNVYKWTGCLSLLALLGIAPAALACRCPQQTLETYFANADTVARVRVLAVRESDQQRIATLAVMEQFKGDAPQTLITATSSAACGLYLQPDQELWLFGTVETAGVAANSCNGTRKIDLDFVDTPAAQVPDVLSMLGKRQRSDLHNRIESTLNEDV